MQVKKGEITQEEAAAKLGVSYSYFNKHYAHHIPNEVAIAAMPMAQQLAKEEINTLQILENKLQKMSERLDHWLQTPISVPQVEAAIKMLSSEVRAYIEVIEKLHGNLQTSPLVQLNQINVEMQKIDRLVFEELCPSCKVRVANRLEKEITAQ